MVINRLERITYEKLTPYLGNKLGTTLVLGYGCIKSGTGQLNIDNKIRGTVSLSNYKHGLVSAQLYFASFRALEEIFKLGVYGGEDGLCRFLCTEHRHISSKVLV